MSSTRFKDLIFNKIFFGPKDSKFRFDFQNYIWWNFNFYRAVFFVVRIPSIKLKKMHLLIRSSLSITSPIVCHCFVESVLFLGSRSIITTIRGNILRFLKSYIISVLIYFCFIFFFTIIFTNLIHSIQFYWLKFQKLLSLN